jgi:hypothetical protein
MPDAAVRAELDLGVPHVNAWEPVGFVACLSVAMARHALNGDGIVAEARDEPVAFNWPGGTTGDDE